MNGLLRTVRGRREPVMFLRIFMGTTGIASVVSGIFVIALTIWRLGHPVPALLPVPRALVAVFTFTFLLSFLFTGVCWIMVALSIRLWNNKS